MKNYFKKFSILFVMLLAIVGVGVFQDGIMANAATIGQQLTQPESGWKRYDDTDSNIAYTGYLSRTGDSWFISYKSNSFNGSILSTPYDKSQGEFSFGFYGSELRIISPMWHSCSSFANVYIDGKSVGDFTEQSSSEGFQKLVYEIKGLSLGKHSVKVVNSGGGYFTLDAIDVDQNGYLMTYDEAIKKESITLDKSSMNFVVGDSQSLVVTTTPAGVQVTWKSSDESIATVDSTGKVTGLKEGQATITATTADGLTATCAVTVTSKTAEPTNPNPDPTDSENIVNIAHAKGDNTNNAGGDVTIIFHGAADTTLSVVKTADVKDVWVGDNFTYTIVVTNTGTKTAKAVVVNDPAPNHIDFLVNGVISTQGKIDPSSTSKNIIVNVGDIAPGATVTIKIPATVVM